MNLRKGNVFTPVCHSVHRGEEQVYASIQCEMSPSGSRGCTSPWADTPQQNIPLGRHALDRHALKDGQ